MFKVNISSRSAVCKDCSAKIAEFEPRVDQERDDDDVPAGQEGAGWRTRRICLKCGIKRMELAMQETAEQYSRAINVWNLTSQRRGWKKREKKEFRASVKPCQAKGCKESASRLHKNGGKVLYTCPEGHFWIEEA